MKKKLFYAISSILFVFIFKLTQAQNTGTPELKALASQQTLLEKSSSKLSADLNALYKNYSSNAKNAKEKVKPDFTNAGIPKYIQIRGDKVLIDVIVNENNSKIRAKLERIGFKISAAYGRIISGAMPIDAIPKLETLTNIRFVRPAYKSVHQFKSGSSFFEGNTQSNSITTVISQGDTAQRSYIARNKYYVNGKGVAVGILSDSYNNLGTADIGVRNGELPGPDNPVGFKTPVEILEDNVPTGIDEARAMAEIVHDVAPGAKIGFHTADNGLADFAQGILQFAEAGYKVITDDVINLLEPFYQDGIIAQAVDEVKKNGVAYFSAAANQSRQSYESNFRASNFAPLGTKFGTAHNFSASADNPIYFQPITIPTNKHVIFDLQWDDPFFSAGGAGAKTDLDIYLIDSESRIVNFSAQDNIKTGDPLELFDYTNNTTSTIFFLLITKFSGPDPSHLKYIYFGGASFLPTTPSIPGLKAPTIFGHPKAEGAIATAAAFYLQTPAYKSDTPRVEPFSSVGGIVNYFDVKGNRISPVKRRKPEITAPDGGNTSFFPPSVLFGNKDIPEDTDTFPNFFGTSAAAPHAAGVAALMIEAQKLKTITPDQIKGVITDNAIDMNNRYTPGFDKCFDYNTGYGFIQADKAVGTVKFPNIYVKDLNLEAICSDDPATTRNWKITNPNSFEVDVHWTLIGLDEEGNLKAPPGEKVFSTNTAYYMNFPVPNIVVIDWKDNLNSTHIAVAYSTRATCGQDIVSEKNSDKRLTSVAEAKGIRKQGTIEVYPNPSTKYFQVRLSANNLQNADIELYSIDGKKLYQKSSQANSVINIDASNYQPGIYILKVRQGELNKTLKLIKQ